MSNDPIFAIVRIEGTSTIWEGSVTTKGHDVTTAQGGTHRCDGTNGNENPFPGPTCIAALDDASKINPKFTFDGPFYPSFDDFLITRIANDTSGQGWSWRILLNNHFIQLGGSQQQIKKGDTVLWAFTNLVNPVILKLKGPRTAKVNTQVAVTVIDAISRNPIEGATVKVVAGGIGSRTTDGGGVAKFTFTTAGDRTLKAERFDGIRSEKLLLNVSQ